MKTLELKLKKDVLIVEIPRLADYEFINKECKYLKVGNEEIKLNASTLDKFEFLCKGSELTEEIASELCHNIGNCLTIEGDAYLDDEHDEDYFEFAKEAIISAVESKGFYWLENPIEKPIEDNFNLGDIHSGFFHKKHKEWYEAEAKTFKNPLIFVKK